MPSLKGQCSPLTGTHSTCAYLIIRYNRCMADLRKTAYHYRLHLTKGQQCLLEQQLEQGRWVYNQTLAIRRAAWQQRQETLQLYDTQAMTVISMPPTTF